MHVPLIINLSSSVGARQRRGGSAVPGPGLRVVQHRSGGQGDGHPYQGGGGGGGARGEGHRGEGGEEEGMGTEVEKGQRSDDEEGGERNGG